MKKLVFLIFLLQPFSTVLASDESLASTMLELDTALFATFNECENPEKLLEHAAYYDEDVEFYHDNGGVTWDRKSMITNTEKNVCGNFKRELIPSSFEVHPIKGFGAITKGVHVFCQMGSQECEGKADFVMIWRHHEDKWQITRVLSYGHRGNN
jgi:hypothetical protein